MSKSNKAVAVNTARWAVPLLAAGARWLSSHPEAWENVREQATKLQKAATNNPRGIGKTLVILREQVDYLSESAGDVEEARNAAAWSKRLNSCESAAHLLKAPGATKKDRKALKESVEALRSDIFAAYIEEIGEDGEKVEGS